MHPGLVIRTLACAAALLPAMAGAEALRPEEVPAMASASVTILGEVHDNPEHHVNQAAILTALRPRAVVWEMLTPGMAGGYDAGLSDAALGEALGWAAAGWPDFALYAPVFAAAPEAAHLPGGLPPEAVRRAVGDGAAAVFDDLFGGAASYGLASALPASEQAVREARQDAAHCGLMPPDLLPGMVEAQRLRDAALARAVIEALDTVGPPVAVIAGNGHAAFGGVPAALLSVDPEVTVRAIGQFEGEAPPDAPFDAWILTDAPDRAGNPCDALR